MHKYTTTQLHKYTNKKYKKMLFPQWLESAFIVSFSRVLEFVIFLLEWKNRFNLQEKANYNSVVQQQAEPI